MRPQWDHTELKRSAMEMVCCARVMMAIFRSVYFSVCLARAGNVCWVRTIGSLTCRGYVADSIEVLGSVDVVESLV